MKKIKFLLFVLIIFTSNYFCLFGQDTIKTKKHYGIRINSFYDFQVKRDYSFRLIKTAPVFSFGIENHNFYLGPQYSHIFQPTPVADEIYENKSFGLNFGYRYYSNELFRHGKIFGQFDYSIFQVKYKQYLHGSLFMTEIKNVIAENTVSIGIDNRILKNIYFSLSVGFGSFNSFFLMLDNFNLTSHFGLEYEF